jgi:hypothetical protein
LPVTFVARTIANEDAAGFVAVNAELGMYGKNTCPEPTVGGEPFGSYAM